MDWLKRTQDSLTQALATFNPSHTHSSKQYYFVEVAFPYPKKGWLALLSQLETPDFRMVKSRKLGLDILALGRCQTYQATQDQVPVLTQSLTTDCLNSGCRVYGGMMFDRIDTTKDRLFEGIAECDFVLPRLEYYADQTGHCTLRLYATSAEFDSETLIDTLLNQMRPASHNRPFQDAFSGTFKHTPSYETFKKNVDAALTQLKEENLEKIVLARRSTAHPTDVDSVSLLSALMHQEPNCSVYACTLADKRVFISVTPESLFSRHGQTITSDIIAGTLPHLASPTALKQSDKDQREHLHVRTFITQALAPLTHTLNVAKTPSILTLSRVIHLHTSVTATCNPLVSDWDLLTALHPTSATCGSPRKTALSFIGLHEPFNRGLYAGSLGMMSRDASDFLVAIRSCILTSDTLHIFVGGGIVPGSTPANEWAELEAKATTYTQLFTSP